MERFFPLIHHNSLTVEKSSVENAEIVMEVIDAAPERDEADPEAHHKADGRGKDGRPEGEDP